MKTIQERFAAMPAQSLEARLTLRMGTLRDYQTLAEYHYHRTRPATIRRVLVLMDDRLGACDRFLASRAGSPPGWEQSRTARQSQPTVVAILVESNPVLNCRLRDLALAGRYEQFSNPRDRGRILCREVRCISRVIVHPQWRGLGLAVRLVRHALAHRETIFTEAIAAMGAVNPFFERAGMTAYRRPMHERDGRLLAALSSAGLSLTDLADGNLLQMKLGAIPSTRRMWLLAEFCRWFSRHRAHDSPKLASPADMFRAARHRLLAQPVYYLHDNRNGISNLKSEI